jgi:RHS repeat-associated protein
VGGRQKFTGRDFEPVTGLYDYRDRQYDPAMGRFTSEDRKGFRGGDANLQRYVLNDPTNLKDPRGTDWQIADWELPDFLGLARGLLGIELLVIPGEDGTVYLRARVNDWAAIDKNLANPAFTEFGRKMLKSLKSRDYNAVILPGQEARWGGKDVCGRSGGRIAKDIGWKFVEIPAELFLTFGDALMTPLRWGLRPLGTDLPKGSKLFQHYEEVHRQGGAAEQIFWIEFIGNIGSFGLLSGFESFGMWANTGDTRYLEGIPAQLFYSIVFLRMAYKFKIESQGWEIGRTCDSAHQAIAALNKLGLSQSQVADILTQVFRNRQMSVAGRVMLKNGDLVLLSARVGRNQPIIVIRPNGQASFGNATIGLDANLNLTATDFEY